MTHGPADLTGPPLADAMLDNVALKGRRKAVGLVGLL
jgi:hypothetical protein